MRIKEKDYVLFGSVDAIEQIMDMCPDKDIEKYLELMSGDNWMKNTAKMAAILSGADLDEIRQSVAPVDLADIREEVDVAIRAAFIRNVETEPVKKKEGSEDEAQGSLSSGSSSTDTSSE